MDKLLEELGRLLGHVNDALDARKARLQKAQAAFEAAEAQLEAAKKAKN